MRPLICFNQSSIIAAVLEVALIAFGGVSAADHLVPGVVPQTLERSEVAKRPQPRLQRQPLQRQKQEPLLTELYDVRPDREKTLSKSAATATITGTVFYNDRRTHGLFSARRGPDGETGKRCNPAGQRDDGSACSLNWLGAQYMVVDIIELDKGYIAPTAWNCKKEDVIASVAVDYRGKFSVMVPVEDPCKSDNLSGTTIKLKVRMHFCGDWCFSMRNENGDVYALFHPGASEKNPAKIVAGQTLDVGRMNFNPGGSKPENANDTTIAANYHASVVDSILTLHRDGGIPFYKDEFGEIEFHYPSDKSQTATARAPDEVAISTFESRQSIGPTASVAAWVPGDTPAHEYGHIINQRAWDGGYGFDGVGISANDSTKAPSRQIAFKEAWAEFVSRAVFEPTRGCASTAFDFNSNTPLNGPLGEGAQWRGNIIKALCDWYDSRKDDDPALAGRGDHFSAEGIYSMWYNMRRMYVDADKYGGEFKKPGLWYCDWVNYYTDVRKSTAAIGTAEHTSIENKIRDLIYNNNIGCYMAAPG